MPSPLAWAGEGAIGSVVGLAPEFGMPVYGATKAFVLHLSQALSVQLGPQGVYVQAVLPAATRTEIWEHSGVDVDTLPGVMEVPTSWTRRSSVSTGASPSHPAAPGCGPMG